MRLSLGLDRHVPSPGVPELARRLRWFVVVVAIFFTVLVARLLYLQIIRGERYVQLTNRNIDQERLIPPLRGLILDRHGKVLAKNRPSFNITVVPKYYTREVHERLAGLLQLGEARMAEVRARADKGRREPERPIQVLGDVSRDEVAVVEQAALELPGVYVDVAAHRDYPEGTLAAHVLGYMNEVHASELAEKREEGYEAGEYVGRYGIEKQWEQELRGKKGIERFVVDAKGRRLEDDEAKGIIPGATYEAPVPGDNVVLTLDAGLQRRAERALRMHPAGGIAVIDVRTGEILALVSKPSFDPNMMTGHLSREDEIRLNSDPRKPFLDKTLRQHYFPGSTYKFVAAIAALEDRIITPSTRVFCSGKNRFGQRCTSAHGSIALIGAIAQSCNVYFWHIGELVGMDRLAEVAEEFGFGAPTGLALNGDVPGHIPWKRDQADDFRIGHTLNTAIGQGDTEVTVVQLALAYAALANGGNLWVPRIVARIENAKGAVTRSFAPTLRRLVHATAETLALVRKGLWAVVNDPRGTAFAVRPFLPIEIAGKTGTAQVRKLGKQASSGWDPSRDHAWFAGYAPADQPEIAIAVLVEHGGKGGHVAGPVAMEIIKAFLELNELKKVEGGSHGH